VAGLGGMRDHDCQLTFAPRLPEAIPRLVFRLTYRGRLLHVQVTAAEATYSLLAGQALEIGHRGQRVTVGPEAPVTLPIPDMPEREAPPQPPGREPARRLVR